MFAEMEEQSTAFWEFKDKYKLKIKNAHNEEADFIDVLKSLLCAFFTNVLFNLFLKS